MKGRFFITLLASILAISFVLQQHKPKLYTLQIPKNWPKPTKNYFSKNPITEEGILLGKTLFFDASLSADGFTSCASCHQPFASFATYDHPFSHGVNNEFSARNAPVLVNLIWMPAFHWDGGITHLEKQPAAPLTNPHEMGLTLDAYLQLIRKANRTYSPLFKQAFGDTNITITRAFKAQSQFMATLISANSKYDRVMHGVDTFKTYEKAGYQLFKKHCNSCHTEPLFTNNTFANNGITLNAKNDVGRMAITGDKKDSLVFKVPTLRNVNVSPPYMHDGRFNSIDQVIDFYMKLDTANPILDVRLKQKINLTVKEKQALKYFIYTLHDTAFTKNNNYNVSLQPHISR